MKKKTKKKAITIYETNNDIEYFTVGDEEFLSQLKCNEKFKTQFDTLKEQDEQTMEQLRALKEQQDKELSQNNYSSIVKYVVQYQQCFARLHNRVLFVREAFQVYQTNVRR